MRIKTTLRFDKDILQKTKNVANQQNRSLNNFIENVLKKELIKDDKNNLKEPTFI